MIELKDKIPAAYILVETISMELSIVQQKIYKIRGQKVILDFDLAAIYEVPTKALNQAVKRNPGRFPKGFMFRLSVDEWSHLSNRMRSQFVTASQKKRNTHVMPNAFTEHGVTMAASILKSQKAIEMNIVIVNAFIALRQFLLGYQEIAAQINEIRQTVTNHNEQLNQIYDVIENLLDDKAEQKIWDDRERIGFKK